MTLSKFEYNTCSGADKTRGLFGPSARTSCSLRLSYLETRLRLPSDPSCWKALTVRESHSNTLHFCAELFACGFLCWCNRPALILNPDSRIGRKAGRLKVKVWSRTDKAESRSEGVSQHLRGFRREWNPKAQQFPF